LFSLPEKLENIEIIYNLIKSYHESPIGGHEGISRTTINRSKEKYIFKNMKSKVKNFVNKCESCKKNKFNVKSKVPMEITTTPINAFDIISIDTISPFV
jgi:glycosylphosphatidylinositol transamidase (GPIT) subunit GPI8